MSVLRNGKVFALHAKYKVAERFASPGVLRILHYQMRNWGDSINPIFASFLTNRQIMSVDIDAHSRFPSSYGGDLYLGIGSILHHATSQTVVWGSGLQEPQILKAAPREITAVRGPMTRQVLKDQGIQSPKIFGDPALLLPRFYSPLIREKKYEIGIVSHIKDENSPLFSHLRQRPEVKFISMRSRGLRLIDSMSECDAIASTSLHGLVLADAYGIPAVWVKVSNRIPGNDFKFHDYHQSLSAAVAAPLIVDADTTLREIRTACRIRPVGLDLDNLYDACPYTDL